MTKDIQSAASNRIKEIIVDLLQVSYDKVTLNSRFREDLNADSLDLVELIMAFEDEFKVEISDESAQTIVDVGGVVNLITKTLK